MKNRGASTRRVVLQDVIRRVGMEDRDMGTGKPLEQPTECRDSLVNPVRKDVIDASFLLASCDITFFGVAAARLILLISTSLSTFPLSTFHILS
jgi:hypothetical protein